MLHNVLALIVAGLFNAGLVDCPGCKIALPNDFPTGTVVDVVVGQYTHHGECLGDIPYCTQQNKCFISITVKVTLPHGTTWWLPSGGLWVPVDDAHPDTFSVGVGQGDFDCGQTIRRTYYATASYATEAGHISVTCTDCVSSIPGIPLE